MFPARKSFANKDINHLSYRPVFEMSCEFSKSIATGEFKLQQPLVVADVGAAQGLDPRWELFGPTCAQIGFEPDKMECERLATHYAKEKSGGTRKFMEPVALWREAATRPIRITRDPDASSFYMPNAEFFERLPDPTLQQVVAEVDVTAIPLDDYKMPLDATIDFIKLDVQAAELDVMVGAQRCMGDGVLAVIGEMLFTPHYLEQPWFGDFDSFMRGHGYQLFDIDLRRWRRRALPPAFDGVRVGGVSYGDALYLKDPVAFHLKNDNPSAKGHRFCKPGLERDKYLKLIALAEFFSVPDYGMEVAEFGQKQDLFTADETAKILAKLNANTIVSWNDRNVMPR